MSINIDASKLNVINREYLNIYKDLVNAIPSLTDQWITNDESDPGIVLVKLMSMVGDMLSYNTDKAYLEAFPDSVTQRKNAYQIFKLIGYKMNWYRSAESFCCFENKSENTEIIYLPRYTRFSSKDGTITYCNPDEDLYIKYGIDGTQDTRQQTTLIEGIPVTPEIYVDSTYTPQGYTYKFNNNEKWHSPYKYNINKDRVIDNRIYFGVQNVDQNHIRLIDDQDDEWTMVDNINTADTINSKIFEFSVDEFDKPYIKLIDYWEDLGINDFKLFYIRSSGKDGKVASGILANASSNIYSILNAGHEIKLSIININSVGGYNPETPDDARRLSANYINTFDTLVTLEDFTKFVKRYAYVGNAISKDLTNDFNAYSVISFDTIEELINKILDNFGIETDVNTVENFDPLSLAYSVSNSGDVVRTYGNVTNLWNQPFKNNDSLLNLLNAIGDIFGITFSKDKNGNVFPTPAFDENNIYLRDYICDIYELIYLYNYLYDATQENNRDTYTILANAIISNYYKLPYKTIDGASVYTYENRNSIDDLNQILSNKSGDTLNNRSVNIYITPGYNYTINEFSIYANPIDNDIYNSKIISLDVNTTTQGIDYYKWEVSGVVYLKTPVSYNKAQGILVSINNNLKLMYAPDKIDYNEPVKPVTLSDQILSVDNTIHYVDIDKITYTKYDPLTGLTIGAPFTDKNIISGIKYMQNLPYKINESSEGKNNFFTINSESNTYDFEIDLYNGYYYDYDGNKHYYLEEYTQSEKENGYILIKPGSFCITLENGTYIIKDNGYGTLVCNEDILESSSIQYKVTDGAMLVKFSVNGNMQLTEESTTNIKFNRNKICMIKYAGLDPNKFTIDSESIEVQ